MASLSNGIISMIIGMVIVYPSDVARRQLKPDHSAVLAQGDAGRGKLTRDSSLCRNGARSAGAESGRVKSRGSIVTAVNSQAIVVGSAQTVPEDIGYRKGIY